MRIISGFTDKGFTVWYLIVSIPDLCTLTYLLRLNQFQNLSGWRKAWWPQLATSDDVEDDINGVIDSTYGDEVGWGVKWRIWL